MEAGKKVSFLPWVKRKAEQSQSQLDRLCSAFYLVQAGVFRHLELTRHMFWPPFPTVSPTSQLHCQSSQQRFHG